MSTSFFVDARLLLTGADFVADRSTPSLFLTAAVLFVVLWTAELTVYLVLTLFKHDEILKSNYVRKRTSRNIVEALCMFFMVWLGYTNLVDVGGFQVFVRGVGPELLYSFSGFGQRLALFQAVYEVKNFINSYIWNDGVVFLVHHLFTLFLAGFALNPFLHHYASFFLGISEVSTGILCLFLIFDEKSGSVLFAKRFPTLHTLLGVAFAVNFIIFRVVLWFYFTYHFWIDLYEVWFSHLLHSQAAVIFYGVGSFGLTILQLVWLQEIIQGAVKMFSPAKESKKD